MAKTTISPAKPQPKPGQKGAVPPKLPRPPVPKPKQSNNQCVSRHVKFRQLNHSL